LARESMRPMGAREVLAVRLAYSEARTFQSSPFVWMGGGRC